MTHPPRPAPGKAGAARRCPASQRASARVREPAHPAPRESYRLALRPWSRRHTSGLRRSIDQAPTIHSAAPRTPRRHHRRRRGGASRRGLSPRPRPRALQVQPDQPERDPGSPASRRSALPVGSRTSRSSASSASLVARIRTATTTTATTRRCAPPRRRGRPRSGSTRVSALRPVASVTVPPAARDPRDHRARAGSARAPTTNCRSRSGNGRSSVSCTVASTAAWKITQAVASLNRPSLCSTAGGGRGICTGPGDRLYCDRSGGATHGAERHRAGESQARDERRRAARGTAPTVSATSATASKVIVRHRAQKSAHHVRWPPAPASGGTNSCRIRVG